MKRKDQIKLNFTRNWSLPGKQRIAVKMAGEMPEIQSLASVSLITIK